MFISYPTHPKVKCRKANWFGHIMRRNCLRKHVCRRKERGKDINGGKAGSRRKQLVDDLKEKKGYWKLKEETLDCALWRIRCGRGYGTYP